MIGKQFVYENVRLDSERREISFDYRVDTDEQSFSLTETLTLPASLPESHTVNRLLRALHLALGISYYKTFIPPVINHAYRMDDTEAAFWNNVFRHGLGEFLYKNELKANVLARFIPQDGSVLPGSKDDIRWHDAALLGIGGGKDSIVAGELLKELLLPVTGFVLATGDNRGQAQAVSETMGVELQAVGRRLDPQILEMNKLPGAYNGHVPISLIFALVGCLLATIEETAYVVVANEASASIPQVSGKGGAVNHQWSKSLEFEKMFQQFVHDHISPELHYFSIIRPLTSVAVAKLFASYPAYFEVFTSDNAHFKMDREAGGPRWGETSPKSLSSYILLAPWLSDEDLQRTFGQNFLDKPGLEQLFTNLLGHGKEAVLDCVGTPDELRLSLSMLKDQKRYQDSTLTKLAEHKHWLLKSTAEKLTETLQPAATHAIPDSLLDELTSKLEEKLR